MIYENCNWSVDIEQFMSKFPWIQKKWHKIQKNKNPKEL